jgi:hypothetical protein
MGQGLVVPIFPAFNTICPPLLKPRLDEQLVALQSDNLLGEMGQLFRVAMIRPRRFHDHGCNGAQFGSTQVI